MVAAHAGQRGLPRALSAVVLLALANGAAAVNVVTASFESGSAEGFWLAVGGSAVATADWASTSAGYLSSSGALVSVTRVSASGRDVTLQASTVRVRTAWTGPGDTTERH